MDDCRVQKRLGGMRRGEVVKDSKLISDAGNFGRRHALHPILRSDSEQQAVFVKVVECVDLPEKFTGATRVCLDFQESFYSIRRQTLSYSPNSGFKFTGALTNREIH